jgi:hypothetical protein
MSSEHTDKMSFKLALFNSLRSCLNGLCEESGDPSLIRLTGSTVGFAMDVEITNDLGFPHGFALSTGGSIDHACMVFQLAQDQGNKKTKAGDMTAAVDVNTMYTTCMPYSNQEMLDFEDEHASLGQGIRHAMGVHHCLAKRGVVADPIPVIVLAGKVTQQDRPMGLRCVQGSIRIPEKLGDVFRFTVDRCVAFSQDTDKLAVALYLKSMRFGLINARAVNDPLGEDRVSLCCRTSPTHLKLLSSPIPDTILTSGGIMEVSQGELFTLEETTDKLLQTLQSDFTDQFEFAEFPDSTTLFIEPGSERVNCLVKVHCVSVHNATFSPEASWSVLRRLASGNNKLKQEISKVLLASMSIRPRWHVTVMRNLSRQVPSFHPLSHERFPRGPTLWAAFAELVENVLLPLADITIVHTDIRFSSKHNTTYNILGSSNASGTVDLRLIDLESLVNCDATLVSAMPHRYAVSPGHFLSVCPHEFVFWQVLWMAYVWSPNQGIGIVKAGVFIDKLFSDDSECANFKGWVGWAGMRSLYHLRRMASSNDANATRQALRILLSAFSCKHSRSCMNM